MGSWDKRRGQLRQECELLVRLEDRLVDRRSRQGLPGIGYLEKSNFIVIISSSLNPLQGKIVPIVIGGHRKVSAVKEQLPAPVWKSSKSIALGIQVTSISVQTHCELFKNPIPHLFLPQTELGGHMNCIYQKERAKQVYSTDSSTPER